MNKSDYCVCCHHWSEIVDTWHCGWCVRFFRANGRMPRSGETMPEPTNFAEIYDRKLAEVRALLNA